MQEDSSVLHHHLEWGCCWSRQERWRDWRRKRLTTGSKRPSTDTVRSRYVDSTSSHTPDNYKTAACLRKLLTAFLQIPA